MHSLHRINHPLVYQQHRSACVRVRKTGSALSSPASYICSRAYSCYTAVTLDTLILSPVADYGNDTVDLFLIISK